jgi:hypothetical protein
MRVSVEHNTEAAETVAPAAADPASPALGFLTRDLTSALASFFDSVDRIAADNPVASARLAELVARGAAT